LIATPVRPISSSQDADTAPSLLEEAFTISAMNQVRIYGYFLLAPDVVPFAIIYKIYKDGEAYGESSLTSDGLSWLADVDSLANWQVLLSILTDETTEVIYTSNTLYAEPI
jgi:hypothetical protein